MLCSIFSFLRFFLLFIVNFSMCTCQNMTNCKIPAQVYNAYSVTNFYTFVIIIDTWFRLLSDRIHEKWININIEFLSSEVSKLEIYRRSYKSRSLNVGIMRVSSETGPTGSLTACECRSYEYGDPEFESAYHFVIGFFSGPVFFNRLNRLIGERLICLILILFFHFIALYLFLMLLHLFISHLFF